MFALLAGWLAGPFGSLITKGIELIALLAVLVGIYFVIVHNASQNQRLKDQVAIQQQILKNQEEFAKKNDAIISTAQKSVEQLQVAVDKIQTGNDKLDQLLTSPEVVKGAKPASPILQTTIRQLRNRY